MKPFKYFFCLLLGCCLSLLETAVAQRVSDGLELPADFVRVKQLSELTTEGWYTLGGVDVEGHLVYMMNEVLSNRKMDAINSLREPPESQRFQNTRLIWRMVRLDNNSIALQSGLDGTFLTRKHDGELGLQLTNKQTEQARWQVRTGKFGDFLLADPTAPNRTLSVITNMNGQGTYSCFDNYSQSDSPGLCIYKKPQRAIEVPGYVELPAEGQRLVLYDEQQFRQLDGGAASVHDYALADGTLAPDGEMDIWTCRYRGMHHFVLERDGIFLTYDLVAGSQADEWQILKGYLCTVEEQPRYLCYDAPSSRWTVRMADEAAAMAHWAAVAASPQRQVDGAGVCRLYGGWSASALSALDWQGVRCLDLTAISLPLQARDFSGVAETANLPVFVSEKSQDLVPGSWNFVVTCGIKNRLLRPTMLVDGASFYTDRAFSVEAGQMEYVRECTGEDEWQTLCLPFDVRSPEVPLAVLVGCTGEALEFEPVTEVKGGCPCLIPTSGMSGFSVSSEACTVAAGCGRMAVMQGSYQEILVQPGKSGFFLAPGGMSFDQAAPGSHLAPFRAYLVFNPDKYADSLHIQKK